MKVTPKKQNAPKSAKKSVKKAKSLKSPKANSSSRKQGQPSDEAKVGKEAKSQSLRIKLLEEKLKDALKANRKLARDNERLTEQLYDVNSQHHHTLAGKNEEIKEWRRKAALAQSKSSASPALQGQGTVRDRELQEQVTKLKNSLKTCKQALAEALSRLPP